MDEMKSKAEIKQHKGLDVARYSAIAGTKGLAKERDVGHSRQRVKLASQPALRPSRNPPWIARMVQAMCRQEQSRGRASSEVTFESGLQSALYRLKSGLCGF